MEKICLECSNLFSYDPSGNHGGNKTQRYCSKECRLKAWSSNKTTPRALCHPDKKRVAFGLCSACYQVLHRKGKPKVSLTSHGVVLPKGYYTYTWLRANGTPYYIGKGKGDRGFVSYSHRVNRPKNVFRIFIQNWESEERAFEMEKWYISFYGRKDNGTRILRSMSDGGENPPSKKGFKHSEETKRKMSESHLKRK